MIWSATVSMPVPGPLEQQRVVLPHEGHQHVGVAEALGGGEAGELLHPRQKQVEASL